MDQNIFSLAPSINTEQLTGLAGDRMVEKAKDLPRQSLGDIRKAANEFEGFFLSYLLKVMRETVPTGLIENKMGHLFDSLYDQELGLRGAQAGGIGLADLMVRAYTQNQGIGQKNSETTLSSPHETLPIQGSRG